MAIARNATNTIGTVSASAVTTLAASWGATTTVGSTLILAVSWNPNSTNGITVSVPGGWSLAASATRSVGGLDTMKNAVYTKQNASANSGSVSCTFSSASYATVHLVEITGAATVSLDQNATNNASSLTVDSGATGTTTQAAEYLFAFLCNANSATTQTGTPTNTFVQVNQQASAGTGVDHIVGAIYDRTVAATASYTTSVLMSGATSRSWVGIIITLKEATGGGSTIQASFGSATGGTVFRSWTGLSARTTSADVSPTPATYGTTFNLRSCYQFWYNFEPNAPTNINTGTYNWTGLAASIQAAADSQLTADPWRLIFRIEMGFAAPAWIFTTSVQPCTEWFLVDPANTSPGATLHNNHVPAFLDGTGAYEPNLLAHQNRMLKAINAYLNQPDGHGNKLGDWVYFMAVAGPTAQPGTEMTTQNGVSTALPGGFHYDGPSAYAAGQTTYRGINSNQWLNIQSNSATRQTWIKNAWITAIGAHMTNLTACRSSVALGSIFADGWGGAKSIATVQGAQYGDRLVFMTTSLQTDTVPYPTGTYRGWSTDADTAMRNAIAVGSPIGFQTAGASTLSSEAKQKAAFDSGLGDYNMAFFETSPGQAANYFPASTTGTGWPGEAAAQALLVPATGGATGQITGQATFSLTPTLVQNANRYVVDTFSRTVANGWGAADQGGSYTVTGTAANFAVGSGVGTMSVPAANTERIANLANVSMDDTDQRIKFIVNTLPVGAAATIRVYARQQDASNLYQLGIFITVSGAFQVHAKKLIGGVQTAIGSNATVTGLSFSTSTTYWMRAAVTDSSPSNLFIKVWADGTVEPDWQFLAQDSDAVLQGTGSVSLVSRLETGETALPILFTYDSYQVFDVSPSLQMDGVATFTETPTGSSINVATGDGKIRTPRS